MALKKSKAQTGSSRNQVRASKPTYEVNKEKLKTKDIDSFNLENILEFGGEKEDYDLLVDVDEEEEVVTQDEMQEDSRVTHNELEKFIKEIGLESELEKIDEHTAKNDTKPKHNRKTMVAPPVIELHEKITMLEYNKQDKLLLRSCVPWFQQIIDLPKTESSLKPQQLESLHKVAVQYWKHEITLYEKEKEQDTSSDQQWLRTVLKSGTQSDKVAALTMITQESPVHCMRSVESLMNMARKKSRREALIAIDSLRHLWVSDLLPDCKLRSFHQYAIEDLKTILCKDGSKEVQVKLLILLAYQHQLKSIYKDFVDIVETLSKDALVNIRNKILGIVYELLVMKPEQEQRLLSMLVNKLGDPEKKVASKVTYLLTQLVTKHPNMKEVVVDEVNRMLYRPNVAEKAQYYGICFLNQIILSQRESKLAAKLINIHFTFFKILAKKEKSRKQDARDTKLISALLTGINRAFPYADCDDDTFTEHLNTLFRLTHTKNLGTSIQAFMLIFQVMESRQSISDRFYQALYEKLLDPDIKTASKHTMLLNLIFKAVKNDPVLKRVKAFIKRLLQTCSKEDASFTCGVLFLISKLIKGKPGIRALIEQAEGENEEEHFDDVPDEEDLNTEQPPETKGEQNHYKGDPLQDFTLIKFLDRFMYRNPKTKEAVNSQSLMQPQELSCRSKEQPVNSKMFLQVAEENVRVDELFFYRYFKKKESVTKKASRDDLKDENLEEDDADVSTMDFAGEMARGKMKKTKSKKGGNESDSSDDESTFDYNDMLSESDEEFGDSNVNKKNFSDKDYEDALMENLNSDGESIDGENADRNESNRKVDSMFAEAEEFSHMLEEGAGNVHQKQKNWEERKERWGRKPQRKQTSHKRKSTNARRTPSAKKKRK